MSDSIDNVTRFLGLLDDGNTVHASAAYTYPCGTNYAEALARDLREVLYPLCGYVATDVQTRIEEER